MLPLGQIEPLDPDRPTAAQTDGLNGVIGHVPEVGYLAVADPAGSAGAVSN